LQFEPVAQTLKVKTDAAGFYSCQMDEEYFVMDAV
jgi:hypothetical protein